MNLACSSKKKGLKWGVIAGIYIIVFFALFLIPIVPVRWMVAALIVTFTPYLFVKPRGDENADCGKSA